ncbi:MAG: hypothetical protein ACKOEM_23065, partial [Planctomycetia bacterium]
STSGVTDSVATLLGRAAGLDAPPVAVVWITGAEIGFSSGTETVSVARQYGQRAERPTSSLRTLSDLPQLGQGMEKNMTRPRRRLPGCGDNRIASFGEAVIPQPSGQ